MKTAAICALGVALMALAASQRLSTEDDFRQFYRAASLAQSHESVFARPSFSPATNSESSYLPFNRVPSYAAVLGPLASLPYTAARWVWLAISGMAFLACIWLLPCGRDRLATGLAWSFPVAVTFALGQDIGLILMFALAAARVYSTGREFCAGLVASLIAIKVSFLPATGLVFLAKSRRGSLGFGIGVALQLAGSFAIGGMEWPAEYSASLQRSLSAFEVRRMPNVRAIVTSLSLPDALYVLAAASIFIALFVACRKLSFTDAMTLALAAAVIASPYCFIYDAVLITPLLASTASMDSWDGMLAGAALTPMPWLMLMAGNGTMLLLGSALATASVLFAAARFLKLSLAPAVAVPAYG